VSLSAICNDDYVGSIRINHFDGCFHSDHLIEDLSELIRFIDLFNLPTLFTEFPLIASVMDSMWNLGVKKDAYIAGDTGMGSLLIKLSSYPVTLSYQLDT